MVYQWSGAFDVPALQCRHDMIDHRFQRHHVDALLYKTQGWRHGRSRGRTAGIRLYTVLHRPQKEI